MEKIVRKSKVVRKPKIDRRGKLRAANFLLEFSDYAQLEILASQDDRTVGYCIRAAIRDYIRSNAEKKGGVLYE